MGKDLAAMTPAELKTIEEEATTNTKETAQGGRLFLLLADAEKYGPLKTQLDNNLLTRKHEYPSNVLAVNRLMTDFVPSGEWPV